VHRGRGASLTEVFSIAAESVRSFSLNPLESPLLLFFPLPPASSLWYSVVWPLELARHHLADLSPNPLLLPLRLSFKPRFGNIAMMTTTTIRQIPTTLMIWRMIEVEGECRVQREVQVLVQSLSRFFSLTGKLIGRKSNR